MPESRPRELHGHGGQHVPARCGHSEVLDGEQSGHGWARLPISCKGRWRDEPSRARGLTRLGAAEVGHRRRRKASGAGHAPGAGLFSWKGKGEQF